MERSKPKPGQLREGVAYLRSRSDILVIMVVIAVVSAMTLNFPVTLAAMVRSTFHMEADAYGNVSSALLCPRLAYWGASGGPTPRCAGAAGDYWGPGAGGEPPAFWL